MNSHARWERAQNLLCVRLDSMGDVLMTTPAIRALREQGRRITLLTSGPGAAIARLVPEIDAVLAYDAPWMGHTAPRADSRPDLAIADTLRRGGYDGAIIFTVYSQNPLAAAFLCYLADIPLRMAYCRENPCMLLTDWLREPEPERLVRHEVRRQLDLVASIGARTADEHLSLRVPDGAREAACWALQASGVDPRHPWVVIHPGATAASRRYPPESFAVVARRLCLDHGYQIVFTGSAGEQELIAAIQDQAGIRSVSLAGLLELGTLAALIELSPLLIANNTGPAHIAAAVGTPVVDLYALTNPQHTPWQVPNRVLSHDVPCKYCYRSICPEGHLHCLRLVRPEEVLAAAHELLAAPAAAHR